MKSAKLTALLFIVAFAACNDDLTKSEMSYANTGLPITASQNVPNLPTPGSGTLDVEYTPVTKTLNYKITWSNLTDSVLAIRINGPAASGFNSVNLTFAPTPSVLMNATTTPHAVVQEFTGALTTMPTRALYGKSGSFSGSLLIDGVKVREEWLLSRQYYVSIHTKTVIPGLQPPASLAYRWIGEIRGQIIVQ
jgi:hypothetical protein